MIKKLIDKLLGKSPASAKPSSVLDSPVPAVVKIPLGKRVEVPMADHGINPDLVDERAVKVVRTLQDAGFEAYIVGGAVRDLLVGLRPKDFDVATNATPEQVKELFRRAFIIGRRFRIVHVVFGRGRDHEVIEVSTFRAYLDATAADQVGGNEKTSKSELAGKSHVVDASGRVLRDNVWGPQVEDAARRDFTVNAMYYDPRTQIVVDYHGGIADGKQRLLRMIGDPETRYREDPVRIVRVVRFAAKLGFQIEDKTRVPIKRMSALLANVPASRIFDEMIKLLQTGHALASLEQLRTHGLHKGVFPIIDLVLDEAHRHDGREKFVQLALADTDRRVNEDRPVAPSFLLACMLWHDVLDRWNKFKDSGEAPFPALQQAIDTVFDARIGDISGRGKLAADMREVWMMQPRFERRSGNGPYTLVEQPRFRAGFDFLRLRADAGEVAGDLADWWEDFALGTPEEREALLAAAREKPGARRQPRKTASKAGPTRATPVTDATAGGPGSSAMVEGEAEAADTDIDLADAESLDREPGSAPAKKRRRRRRKPAGARAEVPTTAPSGSGADEAP